jgi:catechol 2,3-dioxygenase-like lactoylglutathione lyase family enzyme
MDLTVHHIGIAVADLDRSVAFYEALGFSRAATFGPPDGSRTIVQMVKGDGMIELFAYADGVVTAYAPRMSARRSPSSRRWGSWSPAFPSTRPGPGLPWRSSATPTARRSRS